MSDGFTRPTFKYAHFAGATASTQIKTGPGILRAVTLNTVGATPGTATLADNTVPNTSTPISIIADTASQTPVTLEYDIAFNNGLVYTNAGGTTADVTVCYQ